MHDAGYDHPLYSFELLSRTTALPPALARYVLPIPQGFLTVRAPLLRRGGRTHSDACYKAVAFVLGFHEGRPFGRYGLGSDWADAMRYWNERMMDLYGRRCNLGHERSVRRRLEAPQLLPEARRLWQHVGIASRLAGVGRTIAAGRAPRARLLLLERLRQLQAEVSAPDRAARLARFGFGPEEQVRLAEIIAGIGGWREAEDQHGDERRTLSDSITVIRAALIGDLSRLSQITRLVDARGVHHVRVGRLLGRGRKRRRTVPSPSPSPELGPPPAG